jgi:hypothetical protein
MKKAPSRLSKYTRKATKGVKTPLFRVSPSFLLVAFTSGVLSVLIGSLLAVTLFKIYVPLESLKVVTKVETVYTGYQPQNEIEELICQEKYEWNCELAIAVAKCESGLNTNALLSSKVEYSVGIFQINLAKNYGQGKHIHWDKALGANLEEKQTWLEIPENNIEVAYKIWKAQNFKPWSCFTSLKFANYL